MSPKIFKKNATITKDRNKKGSISLIHLQPLIYIYLEVLMKLSSFNFINSDYKAHKMSRLNIYMIFIIIYMLQTRELEVTIL